MSFPSATLVLITLNVAIFALLKQSGWLDQALYDYGMSPAAVLRGQGLHTLVTSAFMHVNEWHLIGNMIPLLIFGIILERRIGTPKFLTIYIFTHLAAIMFDAAVRAGSPIPAVGASAAISGVLGACFLGYPWARGPLGYLLFIAWPLLSLLLPAWVAFLVFIIIVVPAILLTLTVLAPIWPFLLAFITYQLVIGVQVAQGLVETGIGYWAHITGFLAGMLLVMVLKPGEEKIESRDEFPAIR